LAKIHHQKLKTKRPNAYHVLMLHVVTLQPCKNNFNNFQCISVNFSDSTVVRGLTHQKHKLNIIVLLVGSEIYCRVFICHSTIRGRRVTA